MKKLALGQWLAQYGERIGLGVALVVMLVLALWGLLSSGPDLQPDQISATVREGETRLRQGAASPDALQKFLPVRVANIEANLAEVGAAIPTGVLTVDKRIGSEVAVTGLIKRNPQVRQPLAPQIAPVYVVHTQFRVECQRNDRTNKPMCYTYVIKPKPGVKTPELKAVPLKPNDPRQRELQQRFELWRQMMQGMGMMGPGAGFGPGGLLGPGGPPGPGLGGKPGPIGPAVGAGGGEGSGPGAAGPMVGPFGTPQVETQYEIARVLTTESDKYDLAEFLNCREAVLLVAAFPYADQMQEIADALLLDRNQVWSLFHSFQVEKRVFALGDRLRGIPDDLIIWDRQSNQIRRVAYTEDLPNKEELGWLPVNVEAAALQVASAIEFERETDPYWQILLNHSKNLVMRLPKMLGSGTYPWKELALAYSEIKATLKKIEQNQKLYEKPPPEDERLNPRIRDAFEGEEMPTRGGAAFRGGEGSDVGMSRGGFGSGPAPGPIKPQVGGGAPGTGAAGPRTPSPDGVTQPGAQQPTPIIYNEWPDFCLIRFLDIFDRESDMRFDPIYSGGRPIGVQYRVRVILSNPNFGKTKEVQRPEMATKQFLEGPWSPPSEVLPLNRQTFIYAEWRNPNIPPDVALVQVHRWLGLIQELSEKREILSVGDWVVGSTRVGRGEFIGTYTELPLAVWAPHVPADPAAAGGGEGGVAVAVARRFGRFVYLPSVKTSAFETRSILIDFENRLTWNNHVRSKLSVGQMKPTLTAPEDSTPQEVLVLTEDGRLIARDAQRDMADPERQKREKAWKDRLENAKSAQPTKPAGGVNLFGGS